MTGTLGKRFINVFLQRLRSGVRLVFHFCLLTDGDGWSRREFGLSPLEAQRTSLAALWLGGVGARTWGDGSDTLLKVLINIKIRLDTNRVLHLLIGRTFFIRIPTNKLIFFTDI